MSKSFSMAHFNGMKNTTYLFSFRFHTVLKKLFIEVDGQTSRLLHHSTVYFVAIYIFKFNFILVALNYQLCYSITNSIIFRHYIINYQPSSTTFRTQHFRVVPNFIYIPYYKIILYSHVRPPT